MALFSNIFSRKKPLSLEGMTDWHCHILPGVDDGVTEMDEALRILKSYEDAGIAEVWLTPHIMEDLPNSTESLRQRFDELAELYHGPIKLHLAAENMIDQLFMDRLETGDLLPIGNEGRTLLVETSYFSEPMRFYDKLESVKAKGFYPLLAHPERYNYMDSISNYKRLHEMGVRFQVNLMSLSGYYGPIARDKAMKFLSEGMVDRFGTDLHRHEHLEIIRSMKLSKKIRNKVEEIKSKF